MHLSDPTTSCEAKKQRLNGVLAVTRGYRFVSSGRGVASVMAVLAMVAFLAPPASSARSAQPPYPLTPQGAVKSLYHSRGTLLRSCKPTIDGELYLLTIVRTPNGKLSRAAFAFINTAGYYAFWKDNLPRGRAAKASMLSTSFSDGRGVREQLSETVARIHKACGIRPLPDPWYGSVGYMSGRIQLASRLPLPEGTGRIVEVKSCHGIGESIWGSSTGDQYSTQYLTREDRAAGTRLYRSIRCTVIAHVDSRTANHPFYRLDVLLRITGDGTWDGRMASRPVNLGAYCPPSYVCS
jgi:hypothetical protein